MNAAYCLPPVDLDDAPGSPEAIANGCTCAATDNHYGKGYRGHADVFVVAERCAVHGAAEALQA